MKVFYTADGSTAAVGTGATSASEGLYCTVHFRSTVK